MQKTKEWKNLKIKKEQSNTGDGEKPPSPSNDYDSDALNPGPGPTTAEKIFTDPKPGPIFEESGQCEPIHEENLEHRVVELQAISNAPTVNTKSTRVTIITDNETGTRNTRKKRKNSLPNSSEEKRQSITQSNIDFKRKQLEMMEVEHQFNIKIAKLKMKKIELEMAIMDSKKHSNTEE